MIQPSQSASRLLATFEIHCPACDNTSQHLLLEPSTLRPARGDKSGALVCAGCGASQNLTRPEMQRAMEYSASNRYAS
jgi:transcription elongation factor Elf1